MLISVWERITQRINDPYNSLIDYRLEKEYKRHIFTLLVDFIPRIGEDIRICNKDWTVTNVTYNYFDNSDSGESINLTVKEKDKERSIGYGSHRWNEPNISILDLEIVTEGE